MVRRAAVIDIGKSNAKVALVDLDTMAEVMVRTRPNGVRREGPYPHHDVEALWSFILASLAEVNRENRIEAIAVTTHGATAALLDAQGVLAMPVLDYEHDGPHETRAAYEAVRPPFAETGSPGLPVGLNLGAQIFWQATSFSDAFAGVSHILMYPQYWAMRLTGVAASEVTSLGCHTDLWNPFDRDFSSLVDAMSWRSMFPAIRRADETLGTVRPEIAAATGLHADTPVVCGIHDSNASLLPHLLARKAPFAVVSTGTWVVSMAVGGGQPALDPGRDTLINVNALGDPVPSARFMGGREFDLLMGNRPRDFAPADMAKVAQAQPMLLPSVAAGSGPFPKSKARWADADPDGPERFCAVSFYLALMTATCLDLIGAEGPIVVEGPFAANAPFLAMLEAATERPVAVDRRGSTGTSVGTALLARQTRSIEPSGRPGARAVSEGLRDYAALWRRRVAA
ncbi:MAG: FGGY-family carbohydrate kinase [Rhizobiaceae bacterium]|nr:FGGY-family carbohydrate kinase [Rhizobiaceae bacterium]